MISIMLVVFLLQLVIHLINTAGAGAITALAWLLYSKLPTSTSGQARQSVHLRNEVVRLKRELNATSAQDEFSKWAKLRRQHDKLVAEHEKVSRELGTFKSQFDSAVNVLRWLGTTGMRLGLQMWFQKQPMFWLPKGWIPYYAEWILSFPRAPVGGISIQVWTGACGTVIVLVSSAVTALIALVLQKEAKAKEGGPEKVKAKKVPVTGHDEHVKKEL